MRYCLALILYLPSRRSSWQVRYRYVAPINNWWGYIREIGSDYMRVLRCIQSVRGEVEKAELAGSEAQSALGAIAIKDRLRRLAEGQDQNYIPLRIPRTRTDPSLFPLPKTIYHAHLLSSLSVSGTRVRNAKLHKCRLVLNRHRSRVWGVPWHSDRN